MRHTTRFTDWKVSVLGMPAVVLAFAACSIPGLTDLTTAKISSAEAKTIAMQLSKGLSNGVSTAHPLLAAAALRAGDPGQPATTLINVPISQRTTCTAGGNINVTGSMTGSISDNGTGALLLGLTETITDWACTGGFVLNGDPYLSAAGTFSFLSGVLSSPASIRMGGSFRWTGNGSGSCAIQLTTLVYANGSGHTSGQVCGEGVDVSY